MKQLTFFEERDIQAEWHELMKPHLEGISGGCYLCPVRDLCKDHWYANGTYRSKSADNLEDVMAHIIDNGFEEYYRKWKLDMLHKMIKRDRRDMWKYYNGLEPYGYCDELDFAWYKYWLECLEKIEKEQRWNWTLEEEWTDYRKWRKEQV